MELIQSQVIFDQEAHTYTAPDGRTLQGITGMLSRQLFPDKYDGIPKEILDRAARRGTMVHEQCELVDDLKVIPDSIESNNYIRLKEENNLDYEASEYLVSDNEHFATSIDKVYRISDNQFAISDIKTTYKLDEEYVRWQLSVDAYLFEKQNPGCKVVRCFAIWLREDKYKLKDTERIPDNVIIDLLNAEINGTQFINPYATAIAEANSEQLPSKYQEMENTIVEVETQYNFWKKQRETLTKGIKAEMEKANVYKWTGEQVKFTRSKDSEMEVFDRESFDRDYPGVYQKYLIKKTKQGSLRLTIS